jgi:hypothetical protein
MGIALTDLAVFIREVELGNIRIVVCITARHADPDS